MMKKILLSVFAVFAAFSVSAQDSSESQKDPKFLVSANVNYAIRVAKNPPGLPAKLNDYIKDLKTGISYDLSAYYMFNESWGLGLKYNLYRSENSLGPMEVLAPNGELGISPIGDDISISFYALSYLLNEQFADKHYGRLEVSAGYMSYVNNSFVIDDYEIKGGSVGLAVAFGYQYEPFDNFSFGPQITIVTGSISQFDVSSPNGYNETLKLEDDSKESLTRVDLGLTAKYTF